MAVSETTTVPMITLSGNPIVSIVRSNNYATGVNTRCTHTLVFTNKAASGEYFVVSLLNRSYELTFTAAAAPDDSGLQFPSGSGASDSAYLNSVKTWLEKNYILANYYAVEVLSAVDLRVTSLEAGPANAIEFLDNNFSATYSSLGAGSLNTLKENMAIHSKLKVVEGSDDVEVTEDRIVPNNNGYAQFDWSEVIDSYLKNLKDGELHIQYPDSGAVTWIKEQTKLIRRFYHEFAEFYGMPYTPASVKVVSDAWYSIEGGLSKMFLAYLNAKSVSFHAWLVSNKKFLTWSKNGKKVHINQFDRLFFLNLNPIISILLKVNVIYSNNTSWEQILHTEIGTWQARMYEIVSSPQKVTDANSAPAGRRVVSYSLTLVLPDSYAAISETFNFVVDHEEYEDLRFFMFKNSFGVFETIYTTGSGIKNVDYARNPVQKYIEFDYTNQDHEIAASRNFETQKQLVNTGWFDSINELERLRDFLLSTQVYEIIGGYLVPIMLLTDKARIREDKYYNYALDFEYLRAYENEYFSIDEFDSVFPKKSTFSDSGSAEFSDSGSAKFNK